MTKKKNEARANPANNKGSVEAAAQAIQKSQDQNKDADTGGEGNTGEGGTSQEGGEGNQSGEGGGAAGPETKNQEGGSGQEGAGAEGENKGDQGGSDNTGTGENGGEGGNGEGAGQTGGEGGGTSQEGGDKSDEGSGEGSNEEEDEDQEDTIPTPVPNAEQIEHSAQFMAVNPDLLDACRRTIARAEQIVREREQGTKKTADELAAEAHERLVKVYGKDFVTAAKGKNRAYYSRNAWNQMKNKRGWAEVTPTMPELQEGSAAPVKPEELDAE